MMNGHRKSDSAIVPGKWPNNVRGGTAEATEGRGLTKGNTLKQNVPRTQSRTSTSSALERIRQVGRRTPIHHQKKLKLHRIRKNLVGMHPKVH